MRDKKLIQFYLTNYCNSVCRTCDMWKSEKIEELPLESVKELMRSNPEADFVFGGGEPMYYSRITELLEFAKGFNYTMLSNCIEGDRLLNLVNKHDVKNLTISCDGYMHDNIRRTEGNLKSIERVSNALRDKLGGGLKVSYTLSELNVNRMDQDMQYFRDTLRVSKVYFCIACEMGLLNTSMKMDTSTKMLRTAFRNRDMLFDKDAEFVKNSLRGTRRKCDSVTSVFTIYSNGDLVRCQSNMSTDVIANVITDPEVVHKHLNAKHEWHCQYDKVCDLVCQRRYD